jgi:hypothetical protein
VMVGTLYRTTPFALTDKAIHRFLNVDRWARGAIPKELLRKLTVFVTEDAYFDELRCSELALNLSLLCKLAPGARIAVDFGPMQLLSPNSANRLPPSVSKEIEDANIDENEAYWGGLRDERGVICDDALLRVLMDPPKPIFEMLLEKGHSVVVQDHAYDWKCSLRAGEISVEAMVVRRGDTVQTSQKFGVRRRWQSI